MHPSSMCWFTKYNLEEKKKSFLTKCSLFVFFPFPTCAFGHYLQCFISVKLYTPFSITRFFTIMKIHAKQKINILFLT